MRRDLKKLSAFSFAGLATLLSATSYGAEDPCAPTPAATCYPDECCIQHCLGPENVAANAPFNPKTCNGDFVLTVAGFYWRAEQDGMEYALKNKVIGTDSLTGNASLNNLVDAEYLVPASKWDFGFKLGVGYNTSCDGWDINVLWTRFRENASKNEDADFDDNQTFLPIWSAFLFANAGDAPILFATAIHTSWKLDLNIVDIELGRASWSSKYFVLRPFISLRLAQINQDFNIEYQGGSWSNPGLSLKYNETVKLDNKFRGIGARGGLDTIWNLGCGWGIYGNAALSIIYGRFHVDHTESLVEATYPFTENKIFQADNTFRASRAIADLALGVQWSGIFCDCRYGLTLGLGFEQHLFFDQNQMWRVVRLNGTNQTDMIPFNDTGENVFEQQRGTLSTEGWTLTARFSF